MSMEILQSDCKRAVANLLDLNNEELDAIVNSDDKITEILQALDQSFVKEIENEKETILASNNSIAEFNLSKEPEIVEGREKIQSLSELGEQLTNSIEEKMKILKEKGGDMSLETALALLQTAASEMEEQSDETAKKFLDRLLDLENFLDEFLTKRNLMHMRLVKAEKLSKILQRDPSLSNVPNYINAPPVSINSNYFPGVPTNVPNNLPYPVNSAGNMPYPVGPVNMPLPPMNYFHNHY